MSFFSWLWGEETKPEKPVSEKHIDDDIESANESDDMKKSSQKSNNPNNNHAANNPNNNGNNNNPPALTPKMGNISQNSGGISGGISGTGAAVVTPISEENLGTERDLIQPREIPTKLLYVSGIVPWFFLIPLIITTALTWRAMRDANRDIGVPTVISFSANGLLASVVANLIVNMVKRFVDVLDSIKVARNGPPEDNTPNLFYDGEAEGWRRKLGECCCFCARWKHMWLLTGTSFLYLIFSMMAVFFASELLKTTFKSTAQGSMVIAAGFIIFILIENGIYTILEAERLMEKIRGIIFLAIYYIIIVLFFVISLVT